MPSVRVVPIPLLLTWLCAAPGTAPAQQATMPRAFELERRGNYEAAAQAYRGILSSKPGDVSALLGLERVLLPLNRSVEIVPDVRAERWALIAPRDEGPYREWGAAALTARHRDGAMKAYRLGRERLGRGDVLAA